MRTNKRSASARLWELAAYSLSGRLLLLTAVFVLICEFLTIAPTVGRIHRSILETHVLTAELAVMPFNESNGKEPGAPPAPPETGLDFETADSAAAPSQTPDPVQSLKRSMLQHADAIAITVKRTDFRNYYPVGALPGANIDESRQRQIRLTERTSAATTYNGLECLFFGGRRILYVTAPTHIRGAQEIGVFLDETPVRVELIRQTRKLIADGLFVSLFSAILVFASIYLFLVRPMRRIIQSMADFREDPEDATRILVPRHSSGEIGQAEQELAAMQADLFAFLRQKTRLAALGTAVARIQHDLRNILSTALIASDRLAASEDPAVKRLAPSLVTSIDRAVRLAGNTLKFVRAEETPPVRSRFSLATLADEAAETALGAAESAIPGIAFDREIPEGMDLFADREQIFRVLLNLIRNAAQAETGRADGCIRLTACHTGDGTQIDLEDNGPGIPPQVVEKLFHPFAVKSASGGTGLGLAIARELIRAHGGELKLHVTGPAGTVFRIELPDAVPQDAAAD